MPNNLPLDDLNVFLAVMRAKGFRGAARALGLSPATVSETIARLEAGLDVRLFTRTTRSVTPTEAGHDLAIRIAPLLAETAEALDGIRSRTGDLRGRLKLNVPGGREPDARSRGALDRRHERIRRDDRACPGGPGHLHDLPELARSPFRLRCPDPRPSRLVARVRGSAPLLPRASPARATRSVHRLPARCWKIRTAAQLRIVAASLSPQCVRSAGQSDLRLRQHLS